MKFLSIKLIDTNIDDWELYDSNNKLYADIRYPKIREGEYPNLVIKKEIQPADIVAAICILVSYLEQNGGTKINVNLEIFDENLNENFADIFKEYLKEE